MVILRERVNKLLSRKNLISILKIMRLVGSIVVGLAFMTALAYVSIYGAPLLFGVGLISFGMFTLAYVSVLLFTRIRKRNMQRNDFVNKIRKLDDDIRDSNLDLIYREQLEQDLNVALEEFKQFEEKGKTLFKWSDLLFYPLIKLFKNIKNYSQKVSVNNELVNTGCIEGNTPLKFVKDNVDEYQEHNTTFDTKAEEHVQVNFINPFKSSRSLRQQSTPHLTTKPQATSLFRSNSLHI